MFCARSVQCSVSHLVKDSFLRYLRDVCVLEDGEGAGHLGQARGDHGGRHHGGRDGPRGRLREPARNPAEELLSSSILSAVAEEKSGSVDCESLKPQLFTILLHASLGLGIQEHGTGICSS